MIRELSAGLRMPRANAAALLVIAQLRHLCEELGLIARLSAVSLAKLLFILLLLYSVASTRESLLSFNSFVRSFVMEPRWRFHA